MQCCCPLCSSLHVCIPLLCIPCRRQHRRLTTERLRAVPRSRGRTAQLVVDIAPPPAHVAELAVAAVRPAAVSVQLQRVLRGQGSRATHERCERRIRGGNCGGAERRWLRGQAWPQAGASAALMLSEDGDGDGGTAPLKRPRLDHSAALGQKRRVTVATPAGPPPHAPASAQSSARTAPTTWRRRLCSRQVVTL